MTLEQVLKWIDDVVEQYEREQRQAILQRSMEKAMHALAGQEACERIKRDISMRFGMQQNVAIIAARRKKA